MDNGSESSLANTLQALSQALSVLGPDAPPQFRIRHDPRREELISSLPRLTEGDLGPQCDGVCPICLVQFRAHLAEEETASVMDFSAHAEQELGVTRLEHSCKHMFCRKDISMWIRQSGNSCPTCRRPLLDPLSEGNGSHLDVESPQSQSGAGDDRPDTAAQVADDLIREVLQALGHVDGPPNSDQADVLRRLVETLLPGAPESQEHTTTTAEQDYPERSQFGMYS